MTGSVGWKRVSGTESTVVLVRDWVRGRKWDNTWKNLPRWNQLPRSYLKFQVVRHASHLGRTSKFDHQLRIEVRIRLGDIPPRICDDPRFPDPVVLRVMDVTVDQQQGLGQQDQVIQP